MTTFTPEQLARAEAEANHLQGRLAALRAEIGKVVVGQAATVDGLLIALVAGGHALLEGVPGLAKTLMVRTLASAVSLDFKRIQFTPDLMPSDLLGTEVLEEDVGTGRRVFRFQQGPLFANLVLADEINRASPKTQSALLEAMQEARITVAGRTYPLAPPFFVLATQNPIEQAGTYPLPEAQLDRFLLYLRVEYPGVEEEARILEATTGRRTAEVQAVLSGEEILKAQSLARDVRISPELLDYVVRLVRATRPAESPLDLVRGVVEWGAGPRAGQAIVLAAKARALLAGRYAVTLDDLRAVVPPALRHRVVLSFRGQAEGTTTDGLVERLLERIEPPRSPLVRNPFGGAAGG
jgi:MoxR-like ATPase